MNDNVRENYPVIERLDPSRTGDTYTGMWVLGERAGKVWLSLDLTGVTTGGIAPALEVALSRLEALRSQLVAELVAAASEGKLGQVAVLATYRQDDDR